MSIFAYVRCSAADQNEARQIAAMEKLQVPPENVFIDKQSGKDFNRPKYQALIERLQPGDVIYFHSLDRMGRNYLDTVEQWRVITREKGADVVILDMPLLDTRVHKDLLGTLIAELVLNLLSYTAQNEYESIKKRQAQGIAAARARGVHMGRPAKRCPENFKELASQWERGKLATKEFMRQTGLSENTLYRRLREQKIVRKK